MGVRRVGCAIPHEIQYPRKMSQQIYVAVASQCRVTSRNYNCHPQVTHCLVCYSQQLDASHLQWSLAAVAVAATTPAVAATATTTAT